LMICGGPTDAGVFTGVADALADRYRVVTYDPRGNSRSVVTGIAKDQNLDEHADDAAALLAELTDIEAYVFGNSGGAQIGLNLAARHPESVRKLIAHEPPCMGLTPDGAEWKTKMDTVLSTFRALGAKAAMAKFQAIAGINTAPPSAESVRLPPPSLEMLQTADRISKNLDFFFAHGMIPLSQYVPDVAQLRVGPVKVVVGVGTTTKGTSPYRAGLALAEALGSAAVAFPGDHVGYSANPATFAQKIDEIIRRP
jgi:pimeloyl-ACP methyl ester carboxylesterase